MTDNIISDIILGTSGGEGPPPEPLMLEVAPGANSLFAMWSEPAANPAVTGYFVRHRVAAGPGPWLPSETGNDVGNVLMHEITGLTNGVTYDVQVAAYNAEGTGPFTASVQGTPEDLPGQVQNVIANVGVADESVDLTWDALVAAPPVTSYTIEYRIVGAMMWNQQNVGTNTSGTISGLLAGLPYEFRVFATNSLGDGPPSAIVNQTPEGVPQAPLGFVATPGQVEQSDLSWFAAISAPAVTGYEVEYKLNSDSTWIPLSNMPLVLAITVFNLQTAALWDFRVRAINSKGNGAWANTTATPIIIASPMELELNDKGISVSPAPVSVANTGVGGSARDFGQQIGPGSPLTHQIRKNKPCWQAVGDIALSATVTPQTFISQPVTIFWCGIPFFVDGTNFRNIWASPFFVSDSSARTDLTSIFAGTGVNGIPLSTDNTEWIIVYRFNGVNSSIRLIKNDGVTDSTTMGDPGGSQVAPQVLGWEPTLTANRNFNAQVYDFTMFVGSLSVAEETAKVNAYKQKWFLGFPG